MKINSAWKGLNHSNNQSPHLNIKDVYVMKLAAALWVKKKKIQDVKKRVKECFIMEHKLWL
jgi:hypothetical protein